MLEMVVWKKIRKVGGVTCCEPITRQYRHSNKFLLICFHVVVSVEISTEYVSGYVPYVERMKPAGIKFKLDYV